MRFLTVSRLTLRPGPFRPCFVPVASLGLHPSERFPLEEPYTSRCLFPSCRYRLSRYPATAPAMTPVVETRRRVSADAPPEGDASGSPRRTARRARGTRRTLAPCPPPPKRWRVRQCDPAKQPPRRLATPEGEARHSGGHISFAVVVTLRCDSPEDSPRRTCFRCRPRTDRRVGFLPRAPSARARHEDGHAGAG